MLSPTLSSIIIWGFASSVHSSVEVASSLQNQVIRQRTLEEVTIKDPRIKVIGRTKLSTFTQYKEKVLEKPVEGLQFDWPAVSVKMQFKLLAVLPKPTLKDSSSNGSGILVLRLDGGGARYSVRLRNFSDSASPKYIGVGFDEVAPAFESNGKLEEIDLIEVFASKISEKNFVWENVFTKGSVFLIEVRRLNEATNLINDIWGIGWLGLGRHWVTTLFGVDFDSSVLELEKIDSHSDSDFNKQIGRRITKRIEFFGDSDTAGFGDETNTIPSDISCLKDLKKYQNVDIGYAALISRMLEQQNNNNNEDIEIHIEAISGKGAVRNPYKATAFGTLVMPQWWNKTFEALPSNLFPTGIHRFQDVTIEQNGQIAPWDFSKWTPNLVVVYLGSNDYNIPLGHALSPIVPNQNDFYNGYSALLDQIRNSYANNPPKILNLCGGGTTNIPDNNKPVCDHVAKAISKYILEHPGSKVFYEEIPLNVVQDKTDWGCIEHRNLNGQKHIAEYLYPIFDQFLHNSVQQVWNNHRGSYFMKEGTLTWNADGEKSNKFLNPYQIGENQEFI